MAEVGTTLGAAGTPNGNMAICRHCAWNGPARQRYDFAYADARAHQCAADVADRHLVGVDPSMTNTGLVFRSPDGDLSRKTIKSNALPKGETDPHLWSSRIETTANRITAEIPRAALVAIEGPSFGSRFGNPDERAGLRWSLIARLRGRECRIVVVPPTSAKMWLAESGNANKAAMKTAAQALVPESLGKLNEHEIDAFAILSMLAAHLGHPIFEPRSRGAEALAGVAWEHLKGN